MKKIVISTLAVLIACPAFAGTNQNSSWQLFGLDPYIGLRGGMGWTNLNVKHNGHKKSIQDHEFQGRAALGLEVCDTVRSEIEWSIFSKVKDTKHFGDQKVKVENKLQTLMWNSYMEFGSYEIVRPFIGAGVGAAFAKVDKRVEGLGSSKEDKTRVAAMGTLGVTFDWERLAVDLAARYTYVDIASGLHNFGGDLGIRFMF